MVVAMQRLDHAHLLLRIQACEYLCRARCERQFVVAHRLDLWADEVLFHFDTDLAADIARDNVVVTGQDLDGDTVRIERLDRLGRAILRRIEKRDEAHQREILLVVARIARLHLDLPHTQLQDWKPSSFISRATVFTSSSASATASDLVATRQTCRHPPSRRPRP